MTWFPLGVALVSVPFYFARSAYERAAALRGASVALLSQSVDSRNHALVSIGVICGLVSVGVFHVTVVDTLIGLAVALAILRSALQLLVDLIRSARTGEAAELSRYSLWVADRLETHVQTQTEAWLLYLVDLQHVTDRGDLVRRAEAALDPDANPLVREFGMEIDSQSRVEPTVAELVRRGWLVGTDRLTVTEAGRRQLRHTLRRQY